MLELWLEKCSNLKRPETSVIVCESKLLPNLVGIVAISEYKLAREHCGRTCRQWKFEIKYLTRDHCLYKKARFKPDMIYFNILDDQVLSFNPNLNNEFAVTPFLKMIVARFTGLDAYVTFFMTIHTPYYILTGLQNHLI
ncbi:hypothetical protein CEXT_153401 [Caerostris extrusa]|uniref:Uncharacterized protein n=1 Tax=Caerostris extrusa TaxID=172846 RepID=A0AAV4UYK3_CAEEX|nr:hypothetical protein CEXT_153401 [Caerostris extrusa]